MKHVHRLAIAAALALAFVFSFSVGSALAQDSAALIKYRQRVMRALSGHMGALGEYAKNNLPYDGHVAVHARGLAELSKLLPEIFPKGTENGKTDALPDIWAKPADFRKAAENMGDEAAKLAGMSDAMGAKAQIKELGKSCGGCHKKFRQPKEKSYKNKK